MELEEDAARFWRWSSEQYAGSVIWNILSEGQRLVGSNPEYAPVNVKEK